MGAQRNAFGDVRAVLCETNPALRSGLQAALYGKGLRDLIICKDGGSLVSTIEAEMVDLVVCDIELPGVDFCRMTQQIRQRDCGRNPFALIISTLSDASVAEVRRVINAGVDRVVRKPMSMTVLTSHIDDLTHGRRPFVATERYVGPSRRAHVRADDGKGDLVRVPNTLRSKLVDKADDQRVQTMIDHGWSNLQRQKVHSSSAGIVRTIKRVLSYSQGGSSPEGLRTDLDRLVAMSDDLLRSNRGTADHLADLAASLKSLALRMAASSSPEQRVHLELLANMGEVVRLSADGNDRSAEIIQQIAETVSRFSGKPAAAPRSKLH